MKPLRLAFCCTLLNSIYGVDVTDVNGSLEYVAASFNDPILKSLRADYKSALSMEVERLNNEVDLLMKRISGQDPDFPNVSDSDTQYMSEDIERYKKRINELKKEADSNDSPSSPTVFSSIMEQALLNEASNLRLQATKMIEKAVEAESSSSNNDASSLQIRQTVYVLERRALEYDAEAWAINFSERNSLARVEQEMKRMSNAANDLRKTLLDNMDAGADDPDALSDVNKKAIRNQIRDVVRKAVRLAYRYPTNETIQKLSDSSNLVIEKLLEDSKRDTQTAQNDARLESQADKDAAKEESILIRNVERNKRRDEDTRTMENASSRIFSAESEDAEDAATAIDNQIVNGEIEVVEEPPPSSSTVASTNNNINQAPSNDNSNSNGATSSQRSEQERIEVVYLIADYMRREAQRAEFDTTEASNASARTQFAHEAAALFMNSMNLFTAAEKGVHSEAFIEMAAERDLKLRDSGALLGTPVLAAPPPMLMAAPPPPPPPMLMAAQPIIAATPTISQKKLKKMMRTSTEAYAAVPMMLGAAPMQAPPPPVYATQTLPIIMSAPPPPMLQSYAAPPAPAKILSSPPPLVQPIVPTYQMPLQQVQSFSKKQLPLEYATPPDFVFTQTYGVPQQPPLQINHHNKKFRRLLDQIIVDSDSQTVTEDDVNQDSNQQQASKRQLQSRRDMRRSSIQPIPIPTDPSRSSRARVGGRDVSLNRPPLLGANPDNSAVANQGSSRPVSLEAGDDLHAVFAARSAEMDRAGQIILKAQSLGIDFKDPNTSAEMKEKLRMEILYLIRDADDIHAKFMPLMEKGTEMSKKQLLEDIPEDGPSTMDDFYVTSADLMTEAAVLRFSADLVNEEVLPTVQHNEEQLKEFNVRLSALLNRAKRLEQLSDEVEEVIKKRTQALKIVSDGLTLEAGELDLMRSFAASSSQMRADRYERLGVPVPQNIMLPGANNLQNRGTRLRDRARALQERIEDIKSTSMHFQDDGSGDESQMTDHQLRIFAMDADASRLSRQAKNLELAIAHGDATPGGLSSEDALSKAKEWHGESAILSARSSRLALSNPGIIQTLESFVSRRQDFAEDSHAYERVRGEREAIDRADSRSRDIFEKVKKEVRTEYLMQSHPESETSEISLSCPASASSSADCNRSEQRSVTDDGNIESTFAADSGVPGSTASEYDADILMKWFIFKKRIFSEWGSTLGLDFSVVSGGGWYAGDNVVASRFNPASVPERSIDIMNQGDGFELNSFSSSLQSVTSEGRSRF